MDVLNNIPFKLYSHYVNTVDFTKGVLQRAILLHFVTLALTLPGSEISPSKIGLIC